MCLFFFISTSEICIIICRFSSIIKTRGIRLSLAKKQKLRDDLKRVKEMSRAIKVQKQEEKEAKKQRRRENLKRAEENRKKSEVVQVVSKSQKRKTKKRKYLIGLFLLNSFSSCCYSLSILYIK